MCHRRTKFRTGKKTSPFKPPFFEAPYTKSFSIVVYEHPIRGAVWNPTVALVPFLEGKSSIRLLNARADVPLNS